MAVTRDDARLLITCDDLATKPWLGQDHNDVFRRLAASYLTASYLHTDCGLSFVCAPVATEAGEATVRLDASHALSVLPFLDGEPGFWGQQFGNTDRAELVQMLVALHDVQVDASQLQTREPMLPDRAYLEVVLADLYGPWHQGALSENARLLLLAHATTIRKWLDELDDARALQAQQRQVLTHGEPHPGNLIKTSQGLVLLDWDTLALGAPERDLWMLHGRDNQAVSAYERMTGRRLDRRALSGYRLLWALADITAFTKRLRQPHRHSPDVDHAFKSLRAVLEGPEPAPWN